VLDRTSAARAAALCLDGAEADREGAVKVELGRRVVTRALLDAACALPSD